MNLRRRLSIVWPKSEILIKQKLDQLTLSAAKQLHLRRVFRLLLRALLAKWLMDGGGVGGVMWPSGHRCVGSCEQIHAYHMKRLDARSTNWILSAIQQADKLKNCLPQYLPLIRLNIV